MRSLKRVLLNRAHFQKNVRNDGVYWKDLGSLKEVLDPGFSRGGYMYSCISTTHGQTSKLINEKLFSSKEVGDYLNKFFAELINTR